MAPISNRKFNSKDTMSSGIADATNYVTWILDVFKPFIGRRVLEIGTGFGTYRENLKDLDAYFSIDIDPKATSDAQRGDPEGNYICADVTTAAFVEKLQGQAIDTVICANVLEHIDDDAVALANVHSVLASGGWLIVFVPAFQGLYSDMDRLAGHYRRYDAAMLTSKAEQAGFRNVRCEYFNPLGGVGWWLNKFRRYDDLDHRDIKLQIAFFDKYFLPVSRMINPLTKGFFGQSLIGFFTR